MAIDVKSVVGSDDSVHKIIDHINESIDVKNMEVNKEKETKCATCGASLNESEFDGAEEVLCPVCGSIVPKDTPTANADVDDPDVVDGLEKLAEEYSEALVNENFDQARQLVESAGVRVISESFSDGTPGIMLEKIVKKVDSTGKVIKKKVRTHKKKVRLSGAQKAALRKARKSASKGTAIKKRKKAMKFRAKKGLNESINLSDVLARNVSVMTESLGRAPSASQIASITAKIQHMKESLELDEETRIADVLMDELSDRGFGVDGYDVVREGAGFIVSIDVEDTDDEDLYLGELSDAAEMALGNYDIAYSDPEVSEDDPELTTLTFIVVPKATNESVDNLDECDDPDFEDDDHLHESKDPQCNGKNCSDKDLNEGDDPEDAPTKKSCKVNKKNESLSYNVGDETDDAINTIAGGQDNILCAIDPQFIKTGQVIYDSDDKAVFQVLTAPKAIEGGFELSAEIVRTANPELEGLPRGTKITISTDTDYYLLKTSPEA